MGAWLEAYEKLDDARKVNVQRWIHLNKFIAKTLQIEPEAWFEDWVGEAMQNPFDYSFMAEAIPGLVEHGLGTDDAMEAGESFQRTFDPASIAPKVPLSAENNLGRFSKDFQEQVASMLERGDPDQIALAPSDVAMMQKLFPSQKALAKLKRPDFRRVELRRDHAEEDMVAALGDDTELLRVHVLEFAGVMGRKVV
jgi:hypothetical protein